MSKKESSSIMDDIKKLYYILADDHGKLSDVKATLKHLRDHHGVKDRKFIDEVIHVFAMERILAVIRESLDEDTG